MGEALGALTLGSGLTTLNTSGASAANILSFASQATRAMGAVVNVNSTGSSSVQFVTAPALIPATTGVLQGWFVGNEFATIAGGAANTPITAFSAYTTGDLGAVATTTATVKPSGAQTTVTTRTINALNLAGGVGVIDAELTKKIEFPAGSLLIQLGGPGISGLLVCSSFRIGGCLFSSA